MPFFESSRPDQNGSEESNLPTETAERLKSLAKIVALVIFFGMGVGNELSKLVGEQKEIVDEELSEAGTKVKVRDVKQLSDNLATLNEHSNKLALRVSAMETEVNLLRQKVQEEQLRYEGRRELIEYRLRQLEAELARHKK